MDTTVSLSMPLQSSSVTPFMIILAVGITECTETSGSDMTGNSTNSEAGSFDEIVYFLLIIEI